MWQSGVELWPVEKANSVIAMVCESCAMWLGYAASFGDHVPPEQDPLQREEKAKTFAAEQQRYNEALLEWHTRNRP